MRSDIQRLCAGHIDLNDATWRITTDDAVDRLCRSIRRVGLLQCPIVLAQADAFVIVAGFRRIRACRQLGITDIESRVLAPGTPRLDAARIAIADNALQRPLNWIEISRAVRLLETAGVNGQDLVRQAEEAGLSLNPALISKLAMLESLHPAVQTGLIKNRIALPMALALAEYPPETGEALAVMFTELGLSLNKQRQMLQMISETARRDDLLVPDLLSRPPFADILADRESDRNQRALQVRAALKTMRYPQMTRIENRFNRIVKSLRLPPNVKLTPPRDFEGTRYTLSLSFADQHELERQMGVITRIVADSGLKDFLDK